MFSVPGQVATLVFNDVADTSIKVIWTIPTETNGIITGIILTSIS